jgi:signal transduction histidine kinase
LQIMTGISRVLFGWLIAALTMGLTAQADGAPRRVLVVYSFGPHFTPSPLTSTAFRGELVRRSPDVIDFYDVSLETARGGAARSDGPFATYVQAFIAERPPDLVVTIALPAAMFVARNREKLFGSTPVLFAGIEHRRVADIPRSGNDTVVSFEANLPALTQNVLDVLPSVNKIAVVIGNSPLERYWAEELRRAFAPLTDSVSFEWLTGLSLEQVLARVAGLSERSAVLYAFFTVDGAGVPYEEEYALERVQDASSAPVFGSFENQLGHGIVGGRLISMAKVGRGAADAALRILAGGVPGDERIRAMTEPPTYDWRALERWHIRESTLPQPSLVLYRSPPIWVQHRGVLTVGLGVLLIQTLLIVALVLERRHRRSAELEALALSDQMITIHEDERRRLARELHDDVTQRLARLVIDAARLEGGTPHAPGDRTARDVRDELVRLSKDVHTLSYRLHPSMLEELGLKDALLAECDHFSQRESIVARLDARDVPANLPREVALSLFRIAQESLRNVARHAGATEVALSLFGVNGGVQLELRDNGAGFDPEHRRKEPSLGLASMRERARLVGGKIWFESNAGRGTTVRVRVPLVGKS